MANLEILQKGIGYATFTFDDGSKIVIKTTMNSDLLSGIEEPPFAGLFDVDKRHWIDLRITEGSVLEVSEDQPTMSEVDKFVNRFF